MNARTVTQVEGGRWPSGDSHALATLPLEPDEISERLPVTFSRQRDDLGDYLAVAIKTVAGRLLLFVRYLEVPSPGVTVFVDADDDLAEALDEVLYILRVRRELLLWINENVEQ